MRPILLLALLGACAAPDLDIPEAGNETDAPPPRLIPVEEALAAEPPRLTPSRTADLQARAADLRSRAEAHQGGSLTPQERARLEAAGN